MTPASRISVCAIALLALLATSGPAGAVKRITGKLSGDGYTVIALDKGGEAAAENTSGRKFKLKAPAKRVTLHLRARSGRYAGPVVVARKGKRRAIVGVKAPARLGKVQVRRGYAKLKKRIPKRSIDTKAKARAKKGVPIGARVFGRVRSASAGTGGPGVDQDRDGLPGTFDVDDDGDLVLDDVDRSAGGRGPIVGRGPVSDDPIGLGASLTAELSQTVNANAGTSVAEIDPALSSLGVLATSILPGDSAELDCSGLIYCSLGGTGRLFNAPMPEFPECCDEDGDGDGTMVSAPGIPGLMQLLHGAGTAQIGTGDTLIERVTTGGTEDTKVAMLPYVFATTPALVAYADTTGNSASVAYPVASNGPGTRGNGLPVDAGADGDVVLSLTSWRPQRAPIEGEPGQWTDAGGLSYTARFEGGSDCDQAAFSTTDPNLIPVVHVPPVAHGGGFTDTLGDQPSTPGNTFSYTLNASDCLAAQGMSWAPGQEKVLALHAYDVGGSDAIQLVAFERQP